MMATYLQLFLSFFQIGLFSVGGGYAAMPLIQHQVVEVHGWLTMTQFADIITIAEMTPGPIAVNAATFVGIRVCGIAGALVATCGCVAPSCAIALLLARLYYRYRGLAAVQGVLLGLRPAVVAMIASAGLSILLLSFFGGKGMPASPRDVNFISVALFALGLAALRRWKPNPILVLAGTGALGLILYAIF